MSAAPALFADAAELPLHLRLLDAAMEAPCEGDGTHVTVTLLICHCAPLQQRLLRLMKLCARAERSVLLPLVCKVTLALALALALAPTLTLILTPTLTSTPTSTSKPSTAEATSCYTRCAPWSLSLSLSLSLTLNPNPKP